EVHPDFQRRGLGEVLYQHLLKQLKDPKKLVVAFPESRPQSRRFAEKWGFVEEWRRYESRLQTKGFDFAPYTPIEQRVRDAGLEIGSLAELMET
ncbi:GNAT family N-acetyltransferase, partial [Escherichia coli]|nr:GNAT family N-acetyltransferase [Escherichia coli]